MFPLMPAPPAWSGGPDLTYIGTTSTTAGATTFTFTNHSIGVAAEDRFVIVCAAGADVTNSRQVSSCTIGGVAATLIARTANGPDIAVGMYGLVVPAGTTATITVTYNGSCSRSSVSVYTMTGWSSTTPVSTGNANSTTTSHSLSLYMPYGAKVLACMYCVDGATRTHTLGGTTGLSNDASVRYNTNFVVTIGRGQMVEREQSLTATATISSTARQLALVAAAFK